MPLYLEIILGILQAWLFAEIVSGAGHWFEDRYGNPDWPILGKYVVLPNLNHHIRPIDCTKGSYWSRNAITIGLSCLGIPLFWIPGVWLYWPGLLGLLLLSQTAEIHACTHLRCSWPIRMLQKAGLMQSPKHHHQHHHSPFDGWYCSVTDYVNPVLELIRFWRIMELLVWVLLGVWPRPERTVA